MEAYYVNGSRVRSLMKERGLSEADLAGSASIASAALSRLVAGDRAATNAIIRRMAVALGVSAETLAERAVVQFKAGSGSDTLVGLSAESWRGHTHVWYKDVFRDSSPLPEEIQQHLITLPPPPEAAVTKWNLLFEEIANAQQSLYNLDWKTFEELIAELLERFDWRVQPMGFTQDGGVDLVAVKTEAPDVACEMLVQCKRFAPHRKVGVAIVRELWAVRWERAAHQAMLATTSTFTAGAIKQAEDWKLALRDHDRIIEWCRNAVGMYVPKGILIDS